MAEGSSLFDKIYQLGLPVADDHFSKSSRGNIRYSCRLTLPAMRLRRERRLDKNKGEIFNRPILEWELRSEEVGAVAAFIDWSGDDYTVNAYFPGQLPDMAQVDWSNWPDRDPQRDRLISRFFCWWSSPKKA